MNTIFSPFLQKNNLKGFLLVNWDKEAHLLKTFTWLIL